MKFNSNNKLKKYFDDYKIEIDKYHKKSGYQVSFFLMHKHEKLICID